MCGLCTAAGTALARGGSMVALPLTMVMLLMIASSGSLEPAAVSANAARELYEQGYALWQRGDKQAACIKLAQSNRLHESIGCRLNLARCQRWQGLPERARMSFQEAALMARAAWRHRSWPMRSDQPRCRGCIFHRDTHPPHRCDPPRQPRRLSQQRPLLHLLHRSR